MDSLRVIQILHWVIDALEICDTLFFSVKLKVNLSLAE